MTNLIIGSAIASAAFILLVILVIYNRSIVETIHKKQMTHIREIKSHLSNKTPDDE